MNGEALDLEVMRVLEVGCGHGGGGGMRVNAQFTKLCDLRRFVSSCSYLFALASVISYLSALDSNHDRGT